MAADPLTPSGARTAIGVIGTHDLVEKIVTVAGRRANSPRLVGAAYTREQDAYDRYRDIEAQVDVCLFAGPLPHDLAVQHGELSIPATYVPISGAALYSTLLRGSLRGECDPARVSVDSLAPLDLREAYDEIGVPLDDVHVHEYRHPRSARDFFAFHQRLYREGRTSAALTTVPTVDQRLRAEGVPVLRMMPTVATLRSALHTAALIGTGNRLEESQIAIGIVELAASARTGYSGPSNYGQQELSLALHRELLRAARTMDATVLARGDEGYLIIATVGALAKITSDFRVAPFVAEISERLGVDVEVGLGIGHTARDAEINAQTGLERVRGDAHTPATLISLDGTVLTLPRRPRPRAGDEDEPAQPSRAMELLKRLVELLDDRSGSALVMDAERVAELLEVTPRTARRALRALVDEGLAWPVPPARGSGAGRPPQQFRLVTERLTAGSH